MAKKGKTAFLIRSLGMGGTERQFVTLLKAWERPCWVITLYSGGCLEKEVSSLPYVIFVCLNKKGRWDFTFLPRLAFTLWRARPHVLYTFLEVGNLLGVLGKLFYPPLRLFWGIRSSAVPLEKSDALVRGTYWLRRWLSFFPEKILANSFAGRDQLVQVGIPPQKITVVPNGIDIWKFSAHPEFRERYLKEWEIPASRTVVGFVGRLDWLKDHATFLRAAQKAFAKSPGLYFVVAGASEEELSTELSQLCQGLPIRWLGRVEAVEKIYSAFDIFCLTSLTEGFPNSLAEAMASETLCISTQVGDAALLLEGIGWTVPVRDTEQLANAILSATNLSNEEKVQRKKMSRKRIAELYTVNLLKSRTLSAIEV